MCRSRSTRPARTDRAADLGAQPLGVELVETPMGERDGHRALPDGSGDAFGRPVADVAGGEEAGDARLEREGVASERPPGRPLAVVEQIGPREDVARGVGADTAARRPGGSGHAADTDEERAGGQTSTARPSRLATVTLASRPSSECTAPHLGPEARFDEPAFLDPPHEVVGHRPPEPIAAHEHRHTRTRSREVENGLPGRVARADHDRVVAAALRGFAASRAVVDAPSQQLVEAFDRQPAPIHPGRGDGDGRRDLVVALHLDHEPSVGLPSVAARAAEQRQLGAESLRLTAGQPRELGAADALRKAEEVLDRGRMRRLPAGDVAFQQDRREAV